MASLLDRYGWHEWLCHSNFSFLMGASHPEDYVQQAAAFRYRGLAMTDYDGMYGIVRAHRQWRSLQKEGTDGGLRLFFGAECHLAKDHAWPLIYQDTVVLLAPTRQAYGQLCRVLTRAHRDGKHDACIPLEVLAEMAGQELVCLLPMRGLVRRHDRHAYDERVAHLADIFPGRFYLVLSRHLNPSEDAWIPRVLQAAARHHLPMLLSQDCYFHRAEEKDMSDLLQAMRHNSCLDEAVVQMFVNAERSMRDGQVLARRYASIPGWETCLANSAALAERFVFQLSELRYQYPGEMIPEGMSADDYLEALVWEAATQRFRDQLPQRLREGLLYELALVRDLQFADYFLTVWDIVSWARRQDILCQGRGSAANSMICYVLGVTSVDPQEIDVLFERFISRERGDPPDIDVDFEHERREEVIQYIYQRYGRQRAAMVANVITFQRRGAMRFSGKALGVPEIVLDHAAQQKSIARARAVLVESGDEDLLGQVPWEIWQSMAERLEGFPRHLGIHSGGFMITQHDLAELVPYEPATMEGRSVIQWAKDDMESLGMFKVDVLALGMLTAIRKSFELLRQHHQLSYTIASIPRGDAATYAMIQRAETIGTFQIESRAQMSMLPRLRPASFYDLVVQVAIIRPGPIQGGMIHPYLSRRDGHEPEDYPDPRLIPILQRTMGVPIFQEQIMRIAMVFGDFTGGEADELRRHMGTWAKKGDFDPFVGKLAAGMRRAGLPARFVQQILGYIEGFAEYGFPESHAASFALLAYVSSYLKCHHPDAFFTALLNSQPMGFYAPHVLIHTARRAGVPILPVCVMASRWETILEPSAGTAGGLAMRLGFHLLKGVKKDAMENYVQRREAGKLVMDTLGDFLTHCALSRSDLSSLAAAKALAIYGCDRRSALWLAEAAPYAPLLEEDDLEARFAPETPFAESRRDFIAMGTTLGQHPCAILKDKHWLYEVARGQLTLAAKLPCAVAHQMVTVFGMVLVRQRPYTAKGIVFFTLEDETGFINLVFKEEVYQAFRLQVDDQGFLCVQGKLQKANEGHSILVKKVFAYRRAEAGVVDLRQRAAKIGDEAGMRAVSQEALVAARNYH